MARERTVWHEVIERRRQMHADAGPDSMELWTPADQAWPERLTDLHDDVMAARTAPGNDTDVRAACIDHMAALAAWIDAMDERSPVTGGAAGQ